MNRLAVAATALGCLLAAAVPAAPAGDPARDSGAGPAFQVTVFGVVAKPGSMAVDPKLANIATALRKFRPDHGFELRGVESESLTPGQAVRCDIGDGLTAEARLLSGLDAGGKVRIKFTLLRAGRSEFTTTVTTPPNQLFFCEKPLGGSDRLLIGVGAR